MKRQGCAVLCWLLAASVGFSRQDAEVCGTHPGKWKETVAFHRQAMRSRGRSGVARALAAPTTSRDVGNIAILEDADGVVARQNDFNLDGKTLSFLPATPSATQYKFQTGAGGYDPAASKAGSRLMLHDDDSDSVALPFAFPFFGGSYSRVFVNSDGNLTFSASDSARSARSLGRMNAGPPRIAPLFEDLDPSAAPGVRVLAETGRVVVSWIQVPEYQTSGGGLIQTFQARLYPDGRIEFAYAGVTTSGAVVGIAPGGLKGSSTVVSVFAGSEAEYSGAIGERFGRSLELDVVLAAQKFYQSHDDAYDYLVFFNNEGIQAGDSAVSWESTVRNNRSGYGDEPIDVGQEFGSRARLQAVLNMGPLTQYPPDPHGTVAARATSGDTPLTVLAHEAGHLFLAYASIPDENDSEARPMLGYQNAHWNFAFNSEASLLEGNRIEDRGTAVAPRFLTKGTVEWYSPLDQYLMGFRAAEEVEAAQQMFLVTGVPASFKSRHPQSGVGFDGQRRDIRIEELIAAVGRRTPDYTVAQRRFRFAFILVIREGSQPSEAELAQLEAYRSGFEVFYQQAASNRAYADAALRRSLTLSIAPAAGVMAGQSVTATVSIDKPAEAPLTVSLEAQTGAANTAEVVTIASGATSASFAVTGVREGVDEISAVPGDSSYETAYAKVQVARPAFLTLSVVSGDGQVSSGTTPLARPVVVRVSDINNLPYPGVRLVAAPSAGGSVASPHAVTDANGQAGFTWTTGTTGSARLQIVVDGGTGGPIAEASAASSLVTAAAVVNAASFGQTISPGSLGTLYGANLTGGASAQAGAYWPTTLAGAQLSIGGQPAHLFYASDQQINFLIPAGIPEGMATVTVTNPLGLTAKVNAAVKASAPGIFFDPQTRFGAVVQAGSGTITMMQPAARGQFVEIYGTGFGPVHINTADGLSHTNGIPQVFIGGVAAEVAFSGMTTPAGLYQINARVPEAVAAGTQPLLVVVDGVESNTVQIGVR